MNYWVAFVWVAMALAASLISIRLGISVALLEIVGAIVGNFPDASNYVQQTEFTTFPPSIGSAMLTFLAGAEVDPVSLRRTGRRACRSGSYPLQAAHCLGRDPHRVRLREETAIRQYLNAGFVDELSIALAPVIFGGGVLLFDGVDPNRFGLSLDEVISSPMVTHLRYSVHEPAG